MLADYIFGKMSCLGWRIVIDCPVKSPQIIATTLALAFLFAPREVHLFEDLASEESGSHRYVWRNPPHAMLPQVVGAECAIDRSATQLGHKSRNALRSERDVIVQEHEPRRAAA
jgi:hypothetical protein